MEGRNRRTDSHTDRHEDRPDVGQTDPTRWRDGQQTDMRAACGGRVRVSGEQRRAHGPSATNPETTPNMTARPSDREGPRCPRNGRFIHKTVNESQK